MAAAVDSRSPGRSLVSARGGRELSGDRLINQIELGLSEGALTLSVCATIRPRKLEVTSAGIRQDQLTAHPGDRPLAGVKKKAHRKGCAARQMIDSIRRR